MASSLVKWFDRKRTDDGRKLFWDRADVDGLPYRGNQAPLYTEDEFQKKVVRVADYRNAFFDTKDPDDNADFLQVMECCINGWFRMMHIDRFWQGTTSHYVEWAEYYLEDGNRTPFLTAHMMEQQHGPGYSAIPS